MIITVAPLIFVKFAGDGIEMILIQIYPLPVLRFDKMWRLLLDRSFVGLRIKLEGARDLVARQSAATDKLLTDIQRATTAFSAGRV